ncbi:MAG: imidazole glycerol phosphate synthase subunit HisH [Planctomycetes bacterium]|nr:imidazole glycerol phosphate synthase subunit HisH [Planctomycetota bacterium]
MAAVTIVDSGICNLASISRSLERAGGRVHVASGPEDLTLAQRLVLPGVGSFPAGMKALNERGLSEAIRDFAATGKPVLGICLGMQLLFETGEEFEPTTGLGLIPGRVREIRAGDNPSPHMGWNRVNVTADDPLLRDLPAEPFLYFVHSYVCEPVEASDVIGETEYAETFCSVVRRGNVRGIQAHPEKSQRCGARLLENFLKL